MKPFWDGVGVTTSEPQNEHYDFKLCKASGKRSPKIFKACRTRSRKYLSSAPLIERWTSGGKFLTTTSSFVWDQAREVIGPLHRKLDEARRELHAYDQSLPFQLVSVELMERRPAHLLMRGNFQTPAEEVLNPDVPAVSTPSRRGA